VLFHFFFCTGAEMTLAVYSCPAPRVTNRKKCKTLGRRYGCTSGSGPGPLPTKSTTLTVVTADHKALRPSSVQLQVAATT